MLKNFENTDSLLVVLFEQAAESLKMKISKI